MNETVKLEIVRGHAGVCLYVDGENRIGPKPAGGGNALAAIIVPRAELLDALGVEVEDLTSEEAGEDLEFERVDEQLIVGEQLVVGRIVRYVDDDGETVPAIVTHVVDEMIVDLQVFPRRRAGHPVAEIMRNDENVPNTWHWPERV